MMPIKSPNSFMLLVLDVNCTINILSRLNKKRQIQGEGGRAPSRFKSRNSVDPYCKIVNSSLSSYPSQVVAQKEKKTKL